MNKLYSLPILFTKTILCFTVVPALLVFISCLDVEDSVLALILPVAVSGCIYTIPFWLSVKFMNKYRITDYKRYILKDFLFCFLPAVSGVLIYDIASAIIYGKTSFSGFITLIAATVLILITIVFWLVYILLCRKK